MFLKTFLASIISLSSIAFANMDNKIQAQEICSEMMSRNMQGPRYGAECSGVVNRANSFQLSAVNVCQGILDDGMENLALECIQKIADKKFDSNVVPSCETLAIRGKSLRALYCLEDAILAE